VLRVTLTNNLKQAAEDQRKNLEILHGSLKQTAEDQLKSFERLAQQQQSIIEEQSTATQKTIKDYKRDADIADNELKDTNEKFRKGSSELEQKAIAAAVRSIKDVLLIRALIMQHHQLRGEVWQS